MVITVKKMVLLMFALTLLHHNLAFPLSPITIADNTTAKYFDPHKNCLFSGKLFKAGSEISGPGNMELTCKRSWRATGNDTRLAWEQ
ncbi:hypothetical protein MUA03_20925 [Enterobacteriaceae bacterium H16N7]|uniref:hypothetical protein n=1 Tax=Cedecea sulfonylureivorans TaxID=3051154 RepID=UPI0019272BC6|nr:hypothetical protein [Cedecea sulfonylureivorans]MCT4708333.1 hypothetical protein [Dryocola clanedunensis]